MPRSGNSAVLEKKFKDDRESLDFSLDYAINSLSTVESKARVKAKQITLHSAQQHILDTSARFNVLNLGRRAGKALALDTPIPTPKGWTAMGSLKVGDEVYDENGDPCTVTYTSPIFLGNECFEVVFNDGTKIIADAEHQWLTWSKLSRRTDRGYQAPKVRTTRGIANTLRYANETNHSIPVAGALWAEEADLPVDPYVLGLWLGDGSSSQPAITTADEEVIEYVKEAGYRVIRKDRAGGVSFTYYIQGSTQLDYRIAVGERVNGANGKQWTLMNDLRSVNVLNNKHIPDVYKRASIAQRRALLAGLMDSDGTVGNGTVVEFYSTDERLAKDVHELATSLGFLSRFTVGRAFLYGEYISPKYTVRWATDVEVFRLKRKAEKHERRKARRLSHRFIVDCKPISTVPVRCISVDSASSLFLASKACIPTHNTAMGLYVAAGPAMEGYPVGWFAPNYKVLNDAWGEMIETFAPITKPGGLNRSMYRIDLVTGGHIECWTLHRDPEAGRGRKYKRVIIDEAAKIPTLEQSWTKAIRPTLTDYRGDAWFLSTPRGMDYFKALWDRGLDPEYQQRGWRCWKMPTVSNPYIDPAEVEDASKDLPLDVYEQEYLAVFLQARGSVFRELNYACVLEQQDGARQGHTYTMGLDWGKQNDFTVISVVDACCKKEAYLERFNKIDYIFQLGRVETVKLRFNPSVIVGEQNSIGMVLCEQLERMWPQEFVPFITSHPSKKYIVEGLSHMLDRREIELIDDPVANAEMQVFEAKRTPGGNTTYSAPSGKHDDVVMARCLAFSPLIETAPIAGMIVHEPQGEEDEMAEYQPVATF